MNTYANGQAVRISATFKNIAGTLTNPDTATCTVRKPDGTVDTPSVVNDSTGLYHADYTTTTQAGVYVYRFSGTGAVQADYEGAFSVLAAYA